MSDFIAALGLAIMLEGIAYAAFPDQMKQALESLLKTPSSTIRVIALTSAIIGFMLVLWVRS